MSSSDGSPHTARMFVGIAWMFMGTVLSGIFTQFGYGEMESIGLGLVAAPALVVAIYVIGAVGLWVVKALKIAEVAK